MRLHTLIRLSAWAAIMAGGLRVASSLVGARLENDEAELLYLSIDLGFVFAIPGIYLNRHSQLGVMGFCGFLLAMSGAASIVGPDGSLFGVDMYRLGGVVLMLGLGMLAAAQLRFGVQRVWSSVGWLAALVATVAAVVIAAAWPFMLVGMFLGLAFIASGIELHRETRAA